MSKPFISALLLILLLAQPLRALDEFLVTGTPYPPFRMPPVYRSGPEQPRELTWGIHVDIVNELMAPLGAEVVFQVTPYRRAVRMLKNGKADAFMGLLETQERLKFLYYIQPPYRTHSGKVFLMRSGEEDLLSRYEDLYRLPHGVCTVNGAHYFRRFDRDRFIKKTQVVNQSSCLGMLLAKRVDAWVTTRGVGEWMTFRAGRANDVALAPYSFNAWNPAYLAISRSSPWMSQVSHINEGMRRLVRRGRAEVIMRQYLPK